MFPWIWWWAPQLHLPLSGNVTQDIEPTTHWFFSAIKPEAGNARIEERAFNLASYGRQLGLLTDALIELAEQASPAKATDNPALAELKRLRDEIRKIKDAEYDAEAREIESQVERAVRNGGRRAEGVARRLRPLLAKRSDA
jgi:hypothetical protein